MNINHVTLSGNLTRDPELKNLPSGTAVCQMRIAVNDRVKNQQTGEWESRPNYFDLSAFGGMAEACAKYLTRGAKIMVSGKLRWREWTTDDGGKRQAVSVAVDALEFPPRADDQGYRTQGMPVDTPTGMPPAPAPAPPDEDGDDDIPF